MPIAVKNNALILRNGALAEGCECCGGACCSGNTCSVTAQQDCQGPDKTFLGVGTTCTGNPCGCCCVNGSITSHNEQQCAAAGGTWKPYRCDKPPPSQIPLTLSLTDYTTSGGDKLNFDCVRGAHMLNCCVNGTATGPGYNKPVTNHMVLSFSVTTSGTWQYPSASVAECGCNTAKLRSGYIRIHQGTLVEPPSPSGVYTNQNPVRRCPAGFFIFPGLWAEFSLRPHGSVFQTGWEVEVPDFCSGQFSVSGIIVGPDDVTCGSFTFGNPLP